MTKQEKNNYWLQSAEKDWTVAGHLFEKADYTYALFFGHLMIEKLLKALFVSKFDECFPIGKKRLSPFPYRTWEYHKRGK